LPAWGDARGDTKGEGPGVATGAHASDPAGGASAEASGSGPADDAGLSPHENEILVEGKVLAVDLARGALTLGVTSFALPSGRARRLDAPRPKTVLVSDLTLLHVRGDLTRQVTLGQLKDEVYAVAIGQDASSGQALPARRIAVWSRVEAGSYRFDGAGSPAQAITNQPVALPPPERAPAPAPALYNELADGGFENPDRGLPGGWTFGGSARWERDGDGNHFALLAVEGEVPEADRKIKTYLEASPAWKTVRVSARMRLRGSAPGKVQDAHLGVVYLGANDEYLGLGAMLTLTKDSEWTTLSETTAVPVGTRRLLIDVGLYGPSGELSVDDVRVAKQGRARPASLALLTNYRVCVYVTR